MGRIFLGTSHIEKVSEVRQKLILLRDRVIAELRSRSVGFAHSALPLPGGQSRQCEVLFVPDELNLSDSIQWINNRSLPGDIALAIDNSNNNQETSVFHIPNNLERKRHAELLLLLLVRSFPEINSQGSKSDTVTELGSLAFCRQIDVPSLVIQLGCLSYSKNDLSPQIASGLADGLMAWSHEVSSIEASEDYSTIAIELNHQIYPEPGILIDGNAYIPIDLCDRLGIDLTMSREVLLVEHGGIVYLKAIELRNLNFSVSWENLSQTVILRSILSINREQMDRIMGIGNTSEVQMMMFLRTNNEEALKEFPDLPKLYREEGKIEGVNYDIAFCQMCVETDFLRFDRNGYSANNFANLGLACGEKLATFSEPRLGVRSHIQHLKAYASLEPLVREIVDPRFHLVRRGVAPKVSQLSRRWSADLTYGDKIMAMLRRLYESTNLL
jgi:Mannosyl-glycoprotein endo-beta-N-acetylglucosaminidase